MTTSYLSLSFGDASDQDARELQDVHPPYSLDTSVGLMLYGEKMVLHHWIWLADAIEGIDVPDQPFDGEDEGQHQAFLVEEINRFYDDVAATIAAS